jgi:hypothetical protein
MHAHTGAWAVLPEVPWTTSDGVGFRELGARTEALLSRITAGVADHLRDPVAVALLAAQVGELCAALRDLNMSELPAEALIELGRILERGHRPRRHLRILPPGA